MIIRLDVQPATERSNAIRINLDDAIAPEIHKAESLAARAMAWASVEGLVAEGWASLGYRKHRRHGSPEDREPYLGFRWTAEVEDVIRRELQRPRKATSYAAQWRAPLLQAKLAYQRLPWRDWASRLSRSAVDRSKKCLRASYRSVTLRNSNCYCGKSRHGFSGGLSKTLDGRTELVALLLNCDECPFPEQPVVLNVHIPARPQSYLFIENHVSFERLKTRGDLQDVALIFSSGFRGAAARLRKAGGCSIYYSRTSDEPAITAFEEALISEADIPVFFWGDLDYSGMAILKSLRSIFPSAQAWRAGYEPMLARLANGDGHSPAESGKVRQRIVEQVGCPCADQHLIPALQTYGRFIDQK